MVEYIYDRRTVNTTEVQFFTESRAKASNKERTTNMPEAYRLPYSCVIRKIMILLDPTFISSTVAQDGTLDDVIDEIIHDAVIDLQIGDGPHIYIPVVLAIANKPISIALQYTQATASDATYALAQLTGDGVEVEIDVPAGSMINFYIRKGSTTDWGLVTVVLVVERAT